MELIKSFELQSTQVFLKKNDPLTFTSDEEGLLTLKKITSKSLKKYPIINNSNIGTDTIGFWNAIHLTQTFTTLGLTGSPNKIF